MPYAIAGRRNNSIFPMYKLPKGDRDTAVGKNKHANQGPYEAREIFKFRRQR